MIQQQKQDTFILGYWDFRGRGQVLRHLLAYTKQKWENKIYKYQSMQEWYGSTNKNTVIGEKFLLGLDFPNLPYLIQGDFNLTQSNAIGKYICAISQKKKQLLGETQKIEAQIEMVISMLEQIFNFIYRFHLFPVQKSEINSFLDAKIYDKLNDLKRFIGDKQFIFGGVAPSLADFKLAEFSYYFQKFYEEKYNDYPFFSKIRQSIQQLPQIINYYKSNNAIKEPFLPPIRKKQKRF